MNQIEIEFCRKLEDHGLTLSESQCKQFRKYAELLMEWNQRMNLTAINDLEGIYERHFFDCLIPTFKFKYEGCLCDVGAGAGFPSMVLKIAYPKLSVTMVEPIGKRCRFLETVCAELGLDADIQNVRSEDYAGEHWEQFDIVTARAVANLSILSELCIPLVKKGGVFIAMKGNQGKDELTEAGKAIMQLGGKTEAVYEESQLESGQTNIIIRKVENTDRHYPRSYAKIKKHPLGR